VRFLASRWGWGVHRVLRFLEIAEKNGEIKRRTEQGETVITLCNYDRYNRIGNTDGNTDGNKEYKEKKEKKEKKDLGSINTSLSDCEQPDDPDTSNSKPIDWKKFISWFNTATSGCFGEIRYPLGAARQKSVKARIAEHGNKTFVETVQRAAASDFLKGQNARGFTATFDWIIKPTNFIKIRDGNYDNDRGKKHTNSGIDAGFYEHIAEGIARSRLAKQQEADSAQ
jgi:hypothetical protein